MKKRVVSLLLCLIMALSLIPTVAFAAEVGAGDAPATDAKTTNGAYANNTWSAGGTGSVTTDDGLTLSKTAKATDTDNEYIITLKVVTSQETTTVTTPGDAATVLVIDTSGSMAWCTKNHRHDENCYSKEECNTETNPTHWETVTIRGHQYSYHKEFDDNWNRFPCRYSRKDGKYYKVENNCGQGAHNHDNARGGEWCQNKDLNSATDSRIANAKTAAKAFLDSYKDATAARWVAIVSFADNATSSQWYNVSTPENLIAAKTYIDTLSANGGTNLDAGLSAANTLMANNTISAVTKANKNVIALTDGAPTKSRNFGNGKYGSEDINTETQNTAVNLKNSITGLYTICFAASNEVCYRGGPSVDQFLKSIASSESAAKTVENGTDLTLTFTGISDTIKKGLTGEGGWTVEDPMARNISVVSDPLPTGFVASSTPGTYTWTLSDPTVNENGNTKTYTYTISYTVKIDPKGMEADGTTKLSEDKFYPTNEVTTLYYKDGDTDKTADFPVPGVKVKLPAPTEPDKGTLTINKTITGLENSKRPQKITFTVKDANGNVVATPEITTFAAVTGKTNEFTGSAEVKDLSVGEYTVTEDTTNAQVKGYTLNTTSTGLDANGKVNVTKEGATVSFTNAYAPKAADDVKSKITIVKNVEVTGNTQPTATNMPAFQFVAKVDDKVVGNLYLTPKKGTDGKWTAQGDMDISIPATLFGNKDYVEVKVSEVKGTLTTWTYDTHTEPFYINKAGQRITLITAAATTAAEVDPNAPIATFTNKYTYTYTPPTRPTNPIRRQPTTTKPVESVKTGDMGIALYAVTSLLSLSGTALVIKKRKDEK